MDVLVGVLLGVILAVYAYRKVRQFERWTFSLFGLQIDITKPHLHPADPAPEQTIKLVNGNEPKRPEAACDFCQGETEIRLAGQKINCPKCSEKRPVKVSGFNTH